MKKLTHFIFVFSSIISLCFSNLVFASPQEIIIIRHGDKLDQKDPGPTLSPEGITRSIAFALYFMERFQKTDFIIATNPIDLTGKNSSIRELQTVAPLANIMANRFPDQGFPILHTYASKQYDNLAKDLLKNAKFSGKKVVICWDHTVIPQLAKALGVTQTLNPWPPEDFDTVYLLQYDDKQKLKHFEILNHQYPVSNAVSWQDLYEKISE